MSKKKKRRHRFGGPSPQNVALGQRELIVRTVAQDPNVQLRITPAGVAKMSDVLLRFAEPILDRLARLDEKKATLLSAITAWNYCLMSSEEQSHMRLDLYRAPSSDTPGVLSIHAQEPMVSFLNVMRPMATSV